MILFQKQTQQGISSVECDICAPYTPYKIIIAYVCCENYWNFKWNVMKTQFKTFPMKPKWHSAVWIHSGFAGSRNCRPCCMVLTSISFLFCSVTSNLWLQVCLKLFNWNSKENLLEDIAYKFSQNATKWTRPIDKSLRNKNWRLLFQYQDKVLELKAKCDELINFSKIWRQ